MGIELKQPPESCAAVIANIAHRTNEDAVTGLVKGNGAGTYTAGVANTDFADATHAGRHENGGADEISVAGLSGELADAQPPKTHAATHTDGTDDVQSATNAQKGLATAAHITAVEANTAHSGTVTGNPHVVTKSEVGLGSVDNIQQLPLSYLDTDGTLTANSDAKVASQKATKTYADGLIAANDALVYKGAIDCSANPNYPAADTGHLYKVSAAGKIGGASGVNVEVGDTILCLVDSSPSGDQATVGANWDIIQVNLDGAVIGPASSTDNGLPLFDGTSGKLLKNAAKTIVTTLGADDTTLPTSKAVKDVTDANIAKSIGTTKGDVIIFTGSGVPVRLGVGSDTQVLTADSAQAGGVKWENAGGIIRHQFYFTKGGAISLNDVIGPPTSGTRTYLAGLPAYKAMTLKEISIRIGLAVAGASTTLEIEINKIADGASQITAGVGTQIGKITIDSGAGINAYNRTFEVSGLTGAISVGDVLFAEVITKGWTTVTDLDIFAICEE